MKKDTKNGQTRVSWVARGDHYKDGGPITRTHTCDSQRGRGRGHFQLGPNLKYRKFRTDYSTLSALPLLPN